MTTFITLIFWLVILGLVWFLVNRLPLPAPIPMIIQIVFIIFLILVVLGIAGVGGITLPAIRL